MYQRTTARTDPVLSEIYISEGCVPKQASAQCLALSSREFRVFQTKLGEAPATRKLAQILDRSHTLYRIKRQGGGASVLIHLKSSSKRCCAVHLHPLKQPPDFKATKPHVRFECITHHNHGLGAHKTIVNAELLQCRVEL